MEETVKKCKLYQKSYKNAEQNRAVKRCKEL